jgi:poly-gamma-glutamate synthesis protein (capsule biosynthesis protein)
MVKLALMGDLMLGRWVNHELKALAPEEPWGDLLPLLAAADARIGNLECAITPHRGEWKRSPKVYHFRADPDVVAALSAARIDAVSLANNHSLDYEEQGLLDTLAYLDEAGIRHAGAGRNWDEAAAPALFDAGGTTVALIAATDNEPEFAAACDRPGTHYMKVALDENTLNHVAGLVRQARAAGAGLVVFSNHWGPNMTERPPELFRAFARAVIDAGADIYYGHSAHLTQGVELYRGKPILYDTGDFIDDYVVDPSLHNDWSFLFCLQMGGGVLRKLELFPVLLTVAHVECASGRERKAMCERMRRLSAEFGTHLREEGKHLVWQWGTVSSDAARV